MSSGAVIYVTSFIKIGSGIQKLMGGGDTQTYTHTQQRDLISLLYFFQNKESRLIMACGGIREVINNFNMYPGMCLEQRTRKASSSNQGLIKPRPTGVATTTE
jgi:hypothetical protein